MKTSVRIENHGSKYAKSFKVLSGPLKGINTFMFTLGVSWKLDEAFEQGRASDVYLHKVYSFSDEEHMCINAEIEIYPVVEVGNKKLGILIINWYAHGKDAIKESLVPIETWKTIRASKTGYLTLKDFEQSIEEV